MAEEVYHIPALLGPTIDNLDIRKNGIYIDATLGGAGHTRAILARLGENGRLFSFDQDIEAIERAPEDTRLTTVHSNFKYISNFADYYGILGNVDGILADLGVSFHHFDDAARGFSFRADGPLDMRMNTSAGTTAAQLIAAIDESTLSACLLAYGELKQSRRIARRIIEERGKAPIDTTARLVEVVKPVISPAHEKKELAQLFQALRIVVNHEMDALEKLLRSSVEVLRPGGRLAILTYHSLEDRLVKNFMRTGNLEGEEEKDIFGHSSSPLRPLSNKPVVPDAAEIEANPRSRSAKLRVAEKI